MINDAAFHAAISRRPLIAPPPSTVALQSPPSGRQAKIVEYFGWRRKFPDFPMEVILEVSPFLCGVASSASRVVCGVHV